jgi:hypothetical protein
MKNAFLYIETTKSHKTFMAQLTTPLPTLIVENLTKDVQWNRAY